MDLIIKDRDGKASLWIGDYNVWDIPHKNVTPDVLSAIKHAYELGRRFVRDEMMSAAYRMEVHSGNWTDQRKGEQLC